MVEELTVEFRSTAEDLAEGTSIRPSMHWEALDNLHYDLNTCLRETIVLLKSFLRALPASELDAFRTRLASHTTVGFVSKITQSTDASP